MSDDLSALADRLVELATKRELTLVTAESCTAGQLAQILSDAPGAAALFHGSFVTYTKLQKRLALGVSEEVLRTKGAVCAEVAAAMAKGALRRSAADLSVAITGVAGPEPDEDGNPVGRLCIAVARRGAPARTLMRDYGGIGRDAVRRLAIGDALVALTHLAAGAPGERARPPSIG